MKMDKEMALYLTGSRGSTRKQLSKKPNARPATDNSAAARGGEQRRDTNPSSPRRDRGTRSSPRRDTNPSSPQRDTNPSSPRRDRDRSPCNASRSGRAKPPEVQAPSVLQRLKLLATKSRPHGHETPEAKLERWESVYEWAANDRAPDHTMHTEMGHIDLFERYSPANAKDYSDGELEQMIEYFDACKKQYAIFERMTRSEAREAKP